jgi:hypothetical protein
MRGLEKVFKKSFEKFGGNKKAITFAAPNRRKRVYGLNAIGRA